MRPRWRSLGRRRRTTHRLRPEQSGGRRKNGFLVSRGMAALGVPMRVRHGVGAGRGRKSGRAVAAQAVEASAVLRPDQPIEDAVGALLGQIGTETLARNAPRADRYRLHRIALAFQAQIPRTCNAAATARCRPATDWSVCHGHRLKKVQGHRRGRAGTWPLLDSGLEPDCSSHR